jgi:hypothetical protein
VFSEALFKVACYSDISLTSCGKTLDKLNVIHRWPSFAEASEGILLRATNYGNPAKRISAKQDEMSIFECLKYLGEDQARLRNRSICG